MIGVMSGTSLDGIDIVYVNFTLEDKWKFKILKSQTFSYNKSFQIKLKNLHLKPEKIISIENRFYTMLLAKTILKFIKSNKLSEIDAICSHGHTLFHQPEIGYTFQMGNEKKLAELIDHIVVCDFRIQDVSLGGQGAPLVPIGDHLLFSDYDSCLNLGGFANATMNKKGKLIAYDLCAVNTVLNFLAQKKGLIYDDRGSFAKRGTLIQPLLDELQKLDYYSKNGPKSLGIEWVNKSVYPILGKYEKYEIDDLLKTYTYHIGKIIGNSFEKDQRVLATGGGVKNDYLMYLIQVNSNANFIIPSQKLVDYKEALIFGLLGVLRLRNEINCLSSVTGSSMDHSCGVIYEP